MKSVGRIGFFTIAHFGELWFCTAKVRLCYVNPQPHEVVDFAFQDGHLERCLFCFSLYIVVVNALIIMVDASNQRGSGDPPFLIPAHLTAALLPVIPNKLDSKNRTVKPSRGRVRNKLSIAYAFRLKI